MIIQHHSAQINAYHPNQFKVIVIPTGACDSRREWHAEWRNLLFAIRLQRCASNAPAHFPSYFCGGCVFGFFSSGG